MKSQTVDEFMAEMDGLASEMERTIPEVLEECEHFVAEGVLENFANQQSPDGSAWPARKNIGDGHPLLFETGSLYDAATGGGAGHIGRVEDNTLIFGVDKSGGSGGIPGAGVHNFGFKNIPQREFLGMPEEQEDQCGEFIADEFLKVISGE
jgi:phage gpG-like protein